MKRIQETFQIAALLAAVGGFLDVYTYILRGKVFANAQTGNIVLLGINLAEGNYKKTLYYMIPIVSFSIGVFISEQIKRHVSSKGLNAYENYIILIEIILLTIIGVLPLSVPDSIVNVSVSFICSLQVNCFRKINGMPYATTMCTGNLRSGTEKLFHFLADKNQESGVQAAYYFGIIGFFIVGSVLGMIFVKILREKSVWLCSMLLLIIYAVMRVKIKSKAKYI